MVPHLSNGNGQGRGFKGSAAYYLHDKKAETRERVGRTETANLSTDDPETAWRVMAATAMNQAAIKQAAGTKATGRKLENPVFTYSLSWSPDEKPETAHMFAEARKTLASLDLAEHQALIVQHTDTKHPHVHVMVNRVHPETGVAAPLKYTKERLSRYAMEYEREHGIKCRKRQENERHREAARTARERKITVLKLERAKKIEEDWRKLRQEEQRELRAVRDRQEKERTAQEKRHDGLLSRVRLALDFMGEYGRKLDTESADLLSRHSAEREAIAAAAKEKEERERSLIEAAYRERIERVEKASDAPIRERETERRREALREQAREQAARPRPERSRGYSR